MSFVPPPCDFLQYELSNGSTISMSYTKHKSSVLKAYAAGLSQGLAGDVYDPSLWMRNEPLPLRAYLNGYNTGRRTRLSVR